MLAVRYKGARPFAFIGDAVSKVREVAQAVTAQRVLAAAFVAGIFYLGSVTVPLTLVGIGNNAKDLIKARDTLNTNYTGMLTFTGNPILHKGAYININGFMARVMGQRWMNQRALLDNGNLESMSGAFSNDTVTKTVNSAVQIYTAQKERGKQYLFIVAPHKVDKYNPVVPVGLTDNYNANWDRVIKELTAQGVPVLDLRELAHNEGLDYANIHYKTDHHWKAESGFWAYQKVIEYFTANGDIPAVDPLYTDASNFNFRVYEKRFLGSDGKRVGTAYAGVDDFTMIYPKFDTAISFKIASSKIDKTGSFYDTVFDHNSNTLDYFNKSPYHAYGYGDKDFTEYKNPTAPLQQKIVIYGDSYTDVMAPFYTLVFSASDKFDFRHWKGSFPQYYNNSAPDIIIGLFSSIGTNTEYVFFPPQ